MVSRYLRATRSASSAHLFLFSSLLFPHSFNSILLPSRLQLCISPGHIGIPYYLTLMGIQYFDLLPGSCRQSAQLNDVVTFAADNRELCCSVPASFSVPHVLHSPLFCPPLSLSISLLCRSLFAILQTAMSAWLGLNCMSRISPREGVQHKVCIIKV